jgi:hypothetical protein
LVGSGFDNPDDPQTQRYEGDIDDCLFHKLSHRRIRR